MPVVEFRERPEQKMEPAGEITQLLHAWSAGDRSVEERLFQLVHPELRRLACALMRRERRDHTLDGTALLNEAYVRLLTGRERDWEGRRHFFAIAARIMRRLLIDYARRRRSAVPHGSSCQVAAERGDPNLEEAIAVDTALDELQKLHPVWCSIVELKYFMGLTDEETAALLGLRLRTMQRQLGDARRWLFERLSLSTCETTANATNA
jgi:RNA polymerase sigma factor (TIGR02999 family)